MSSNNKHRILAQNTLPNNQYLATSLEDKTLYSLSEGAWLVSCPTLYSSWILKPEVSGSTAQAHLLENYPRPLIFDDYTLAYREFKEDSFYVQVTQSSLMWVFHTREAKKDNYNKIKVDIGRLLEIENCNVTDAIIQKDAVVFVIHNQLHVINYNRNILVSTSSSKFSSDLIKHRILKLEAQASKLWTLNDYNMIMIQYYAYRGLYIYKMIDQFKELNLIERVIFLFNNSFHHLL